jgi:membrane fusion protein, heavy metal efflux system
VSGQLKKLVFGLLGLVFIVGAGYVGWQKFHAAAKSESGAEKPVASTPKDTIHFAENAPQLAFLQVKPVETYPEPLVDSLNARLAYDDNHTARVFSPIAGRVLKITADAGSEIKAGEELLTLDAPDYAQATSDDVKAKADLQRKHQAYERAGELLKINGISQKDIAAAEADFHQAEAEAQRAEARLHNLQS